ncbi:MAG: flagellin, partial [Porticoccaceae bacterium]|nr:flagellin [Porticoccaceae bacterium]
MTVINTNVKSLVAQASLAANSKNQATAMERLSTGSRINSAKDDAAGLAISSRMTSQVRGLNMAIRNANDGISLAQTAEGAMEETTSMLQRMRELSLQAANSVNNASDRAALDAEVQQLKTEIDRIATTTAFNGQKLLDGSMAGKLQIGSHASETMDLAISSVATTAMGETPRGLAGVVGVNGAAAAPAVVVTPASKASVTKAVVASAVTPPPSSMQIGTYAEKTIGIASTSHLKIAVNDGDAGTYELNVKTAATALGYDATALTGEQFVASLQSAIDGSSYFTGDNAVTVSLDANDSVQLSVAGGIKKIAVSDGTTTTGLLTKLDGAGSAAAQVATGSPLALNSSTLIANETFGLDPIVIVPATNSTLSLAVGDGTTRSIALAAGTNQVFDDMAALATHVQEKVNLSGYFTGDNAVVVTATRDSDGKHGLTYANAAGQKMVVGGNFITTGSGISDVNSSTVAAVNNTTVFSSAAVTIQAPGYSQQLAAFAEKTLNLADVEDVAGNSPADSMKTFTLNVNGGGDVALNLSAALDSAAVADGAVTKAQFVAAMQKTIDDSGFFTGDNAVSVSVGDDGLVQLSVAGGVGSIIVKESGSYDGLVATLTGDNSGAEGGAIDSTLSGGILKLGAAYNSIVSEANKTPTGSIALTLGGTVDDGVVELVLIDDQGNTVTVKTGTISADPATTTLLADAFNTQITQKVVGSEALVAAAGGRALSANSTLADALQYSASVDSGKLVIKRADGRDFSVQLGTNHANTGTLTPDAISATQLATLGRAVSSAQQVQTFGLAKTTMGSSADAVKETFSQVLSTATIGNALSFDGFTYTMRSATAATEVSAFVAAYNNYSDAKYIASIGGTTATIKMTAKEAGAKVDESIAETAGAGVNIVARSAVTQGADSTFTTENVLRLKVGATGVATDVIISTTDFEYSSMEALAAKVQAAINSKDAFQGDNAVTVGVSTDANDKKGLTFTQASGKAMEISGSFISNELGETSYSLASPLKVAATPSSTGGINLSGSNNVVSLSLVDSDNAVTISRSISLAGSGSNVSAENYVSLLASALNESLSSDGYSVTASIADGQLALTLDQAGGTAVTLSGASITEAFGGDVSASGTSAVTAQAPGAAAVVDNGVATGTKLSEVKVDTVANANAAILSIDNSIEYVNSQRATLGAIQNRLDHTVSNLTNIATNTEASRSRIMDADYGAESANLAKAQIIQQAATAMLAQANQ